MFAVLHIADFALHAVLRTRPAAGGGAAALLDGEQTQKKAVLVACNAAARAQGVAAGQTAAQALACCGALALQTRSVAAEAEARATLLAAGFAISPRIEHTADGVCTADLSGLDEGRARTLLAAAVAQLRQFGLPATGGLAATPLLAWYAARSITGPDPKPNADIARAPAGGTTPGSSAVRIEFRDKPGASDRSQRRDAPASANVPDTDDGKWNATSGRGFPGGNQIMRPGGRHPLSANCIQIVHDARPFLAPLPLAAADPAPELATILATWGIHTLGALTRLSKADIARRLGPAGLALWERAAGETTRVLALVEPPQEFVAAMEFENEIETLPPLLFILRRFADRLALELATAMFAAAELTLVLQLTDETSHTRSFRLPEPTARADSLFRVLHTHLEQLHTAAAIKAVRLRIEPTRPPHRQQGLFESELRDPHGFAETLARVVAVVGSGRVGTPYVQDTHRPDAVVMEPPAAVVPPPTGMLSAEVEEQSHSATTSATPVVGAERRRRPAGPPELPPLGLPLRRFRPPVPARVEVQDGAPISVWSARVSDVVAEARGPWRGAGDWWEAARAWAREEWDLEVVGGGLYRVIRTPAGWFVEGEYD